MDLSVVIVNYNVRYFLEQCLHSVEKAVKGLDAEVFVVDNQSVDGSCAMVHELFPWVKLISNQENVGFSKANNQAIRLATGRYILLLNPDTVVEEDSFRKLIAFADENSDAGGIGVKMIDGKGRFLPESKRAMPTPSVSFYKIFGLTALFPHSKTFARYYLGHLDKNKSHKVEILAGAFMFLRKSVLDKIGLLDEQFFMYGEDIDLSYRILEAGYSNYYLSDITIIHYKGESTKKGSINYVKIFYQAMILFARKHFSAKNAGIYIFIIQLAIYLRAGMAVISRYMRKVFPPLIDAGLIYAGFYLLLPWWETYQFHPGYYPDFLLQIMVPAYSAIWVGSMFMLRAYQHPVSFGKVMRGLALGTILILLLYSLLREDLRFSRAIILLGFGWALSSTMLFRWLAGKINLPGYQPSGNGSKRILIVATIDEATRIQSLINQTNLKAEVIGMVSPSSSFPQDDFLGSIQQLHEIVQINAVDEIIFSGKDIESREIIQQMHQLSDIQVDFKIAPQGSISVIGSNSIDTAGELYVISHNSIARIENVRTKRFFDIGASLLMIPAFPVLWLSYPASIGKLQQLFQVLRGKKSWVGYYIGNEVSIKHLPQIKEGVFSPVSQFDSLHLTTELIEKANLLYSKEYSIKNDFRILLNSLK
ncbi:MAG: glycosyltransferase family 2 protein [Bacteroidales bacterium]|nr:glycosyltransferase family 2 protein [Bacteroidales bacterium]